MPFDVATSFSNFPRRALGRSRGSWGQWGIWRELGEAGEAGGAGEAGEDRGFMGEHEYLGGKYWGIAVKVCRNVLVYLQFDHSMCV